MWYPQTMEKETVIIDTVEEFEAFMKTFGGKPRRSAPSVWKVLIFLSGAASAWWIVGL